MVSPLIFIVSWGFTLILYSLQLTTNIVPFSPRGLTMILMNMMSLALFYLLFNFSTKPSPYLEQQRILKEVYLEKFVKGLGLVWALGTLFEIYYCQGFPLYWRFTGSSKLYVDFGIHSLHGILNACFLQLLAMLMYLYLKKRTYRILFLIILLSLWPIMMLGRGIMLSELLQMGCIYLLVSKIKLKQILILFLFALSVLLLFGILGDLRQTANPFAYLVKSEMTPYFDAIPTGALWVYIYITAGLSNVFYNIDSVIPDYNFIHSLANLIPSTIKQYLELERANDLFVFVDPNLNTSTGYAGYISDFGFLGGFFMMAFIQLISCWVYRNVQQGSLCSFFAYSVLFQVLIFSVFYDMFFLLPTLFQFVICLMFYWYSYPTEHKQTSFNKKMAPI